MPESRHVGLTPQSIHRMGGYRVQGRQEQAERIMADALAGLHFDRMESSPIFVFATASILPFSKMPTTV